MVRLARIYGPDSPTFRIPEDVMERFWDKVDILDGFATDEDCWLWTGAVEKAGYGSFRLFGKTIRASRFAYLIYKGEIANNLMVCHTCDSKLCVNPSHLVLGTAADNTQDALDRGRIKTGESHVLAQLSNEDVTEIKSLYSSGHYTQKELGFMFKVHQTYISRVFHGLKRKHG